MSRTQSESAENQDAGTQTEEQRGAKVLQQYPVGQIQSRPACERAVLQGMSEARIENIRARERSYNATEDRVASSIRSKQHSDDVPQVPQQEKAIGGGDVSGT